MAEVVFFLFSAESYTELCLYKVDGTMPTVVGLEQDTFVRNSLEISTPVPHRRSHGRATALQVTDKDR